jgi:hypothetical protein
LLHRMQHRLRGALRPRWRESGRCKACARKFQCALATTPSGGGWSTEREGCTNFLLTSLRNRCPRTVPQPERGSRRARSAASSAAGDISPARRRWHAAWRRNAPRYRGPAATVTDSSAHTVGESGKPSSENQPSPFHRPIVHSLSSPGLSRHARNIPRAERAQRRSATVRSDRGRSACSFLPCSSPAWCAWGAARAQAARAALTINSGVYRRGPRLNPRCPPAPGSQ